MLHPLIAQMTSEVKTFALAGGGVVVLSFLKGAFELYEKMKDRQERAKNSVEFRAQTIHLENISKALLADTQTIQIGSERQKNMMETVGRIETKVDSCNRGVRDLKLMAGIPETETTAPKT